MEHGREGGKYLNNFLTYNAQISVHSMQARDPVAEEHISPRAGIGRRRTKSLDDTCCWGSAMTGLLIENGSRLGDADGRAVCFPEDEDSAGQCCAEGRRWNVRVYRAISLVWRRCNEA